jgi:hypothetical protein
VLVKERIVQTLETVGERDLVAPGFELVAAGEEDRARDAATVRDGAGVRDAAAEGEATREDAGTTEAEGSGEAERVEDGEGQ